MAGTHRAPEHRTYDGGDADTVVLALPAPARGAFASAARGARPGPEVMRPSDVLDAWWGPRGAYRQYWVIGAVAAAVVLAVLLVAAATATPTMTVSGTARVISTGSTLSSGQVCSGRGAYGDMTAGLDVAVVDASGVVVATGALQEGESRSYDGGSDYYADSCAFDFTVADVPDDGQQYGIRVGTRKVVDFSPRELRATPEVWMGR